MFGKRIVTLRKEKNMTQAELAKTIGIGRSALALYETEKREPDIDTLRKLSSFFNVSIGYLLGTEANSEKQQSKKNEIKVNEKEGFYDNSLKKIFTTRLKKVLDIKKISANEFSGTTSFDNEKSIAYLSGERKPILEDLIKISQSINISTDYLLGNINEQDEKALNNFQQLNEDNKDIIIGEIKKYLKEQRHEESVAADEPLRKTGTDNLGK